MPVSDFMEVAVLGVPWDGGTAVPVGARLAPSAIRTASQAIRRFDPVAMESPYDIAVIGDLGDVPIAPFERDVNFDTITATIAELSRRRIRPVTLGGDHLITLPILRGLQNGLACKIIHVDAHTDTSDASAGGERYSAATPFRQAIEDGLIAPKNILQIGIRGQIRSLDKLTWPRERGIQIITTDEWFARGTPVAVARIREFASPGPVYVSFDIDGIDPVFAPGTGARVPGGLSSHDAIALLRGLRGLNVVGCDLVEVAPPRDVADLTVSLAAALTFEMLMLTAEAARRGRS